MELAGNKDILQHRKKFKIEERDFIQKIVECKFSELKI